MIVLDTHIWVWWVDQTAALPTAKAETLKACVADGLGVSAISCWEVAKLVEKKRLVLSIPVDHWVEQALAYPGVILLPLIPRIAVASTQLPQPFQKDPADQIIVATARCLDCALATDDTEILAYPHVKLVRTA